MSERLDDALAAAKGKPGETFPDKDLVGSLLRSYQRMVTDTAKLERRLEAVEKKLGIDPDAELEAALRRLDDAGKGQP